MDIYEQMATRFAATAVPVPSAEISKDNERLTQWYLEHAFFRDFVYRNPPGRKGKEFSDALVVYDDTIIAIQNKTHSSARTPKEWAESALGHALRQLRGSFRMITEGLVQDFSNEILGGKIQIDLEKHKHLYGIVVAAHEGDPYDPHGLFQKDEAPSLPFSIMTLADLLYVIDRMDTAADFITYFELRHQALQVGLRPLMNDEAHTMRQIADLLPRLMESSLAQVSVEVRERTLRLIKGPFCSRMKDRADYKFSLLIDDIIARAHDIDPETVDDFNSAKHLSHILGQTYGYLDRERRIAIGKKMLDAAVDAQTHEPRIVAHIQRPIGQTYLYIYTKTDRKTRREYLHAMSALAQVKYGYQRVIAVATEPVGLGGRSYDFIFLEKKEIPEGTVIPDEVFNQLPDLDSMNQMIN